MGDNAALLGARVWAAYHAYEAFNGEARERVGALEGAGIAERYSGVKSVRDVHAACVRAGLVSMVQGAPVECESTISSLMQLERGLAPLLSLLDPRLGGGDEHGLRAAAALLDAMVRLDRMDDALCACLATGWGALLEVGTRCWVLKQPVSIKSAGLLTGMPVSSLHSKAIEGSLASGMPGQEEGERLSGVRDVLQVCYGVLW
jgi:hypothetical protein